MALQTGSATSPIDLLQTFISWLESRGWTIEQSGSEGTGWRGHLSKDGVFVNLRAMVNETGWPDSNGAGHGIGFNIGDGYTGGEPWHAQPGVPLRSGTSNGVGCGINLAGGGPYPSYWFFDDEADNITAVVEFAGGLYGYIGFGPELVPIGHSHAMPHFYGSISSFYNTQSYNQLSYGGLNSSGGFPMGGNDSRATSCYVRVPSFVHDASNRWVTGRGQGTTHTNTNTGYTGKEMRFSAISPDLASPEGTDGTWSKHDLPNYDRFIPYVRSVGTGSGLPINGFVSPSFGRALLPPSIVWVTMPPLNRWAPLGYPPSVFPSLAVGHGWSSGDVLTVGDQDYVVFPRMAVKRIPDAS